MAGSQSLAGETDTFCSGVKRSPACAAASTSRLFARYACHATHTRPFASVVATGFTSLPLLVVSRTSGEQRAPWRALANRSKLPLRRADQITHTRLRPSTATAARMISSCAGETSSGALHWRDDFDQVISLT